MRILVLMAVVFFIAACSHNPNDVVAVDKGGDRFYTDKHAAEALAKGDDETVVCERRVITGSHRVMRVCTTKAQKLKDREEGQEIYDRLQNMESQGKMDAYRGQ